MKGEESKNSQHHAPSNSNNKPQKVQLKKEVAKKD